LQEKLAAERERTGREEEARSYYWTVAHFGERVQLGSATEIERLIAAGLQAKAYERLTPCSVAWESQMRERPSNSLPSRRFFTRGLDDAPLLLFIACLGLFITYSPFAEAFGHSTSPEGVWAALGPLWFSLNSHLGSSNTSALRNPLLAYFECAAGASLAVVAMRALLLRRETS